MSDDKVLSISNWAPGESICRCVACGMIFPGDKRSTNCLSCGAKAYAMASLSNVHDEAIAELQHEITRLRADLQNAIMADTEYCVELERINQALIEAPTVDVDVVVPERDYSAMTPRDCYKAGLLDGVYQARAAIKAAVRAALKEDGDD